MSANPELFDEIDFTGIKSFADIDRRSDTYISHDERIAAINIPAEIAARSDKLRLTGRVNGDWIECHAITRTDDNPSAGINRVTGVYHDLGTGISLSLFQWLDYVDGGTKFVPIATSSAEPKAKKREPLTLSSGEVIEDSIRDPDGKLPWSVYANACKLAKVDISDLDDEPDGTRLGGIIERFAAAHGISGNDAWREIDRPRYRLRFYEWSKSTTRAYCYAKGAGITPEAIRLCGGELAVHLFDKRDHYRQYVIAFPVFNGPLWTDGIESGWVIAPQDGKNLIFSRGKHVTEKRKTSTVKGTVGGLIGYHAIKILLDKTSSPSIIWKVEGISDLLAMQAAILAAGVSDTHLVVTNSGGAIQTPKDEWIDLLAGSGAEIYVLQDADDAGDKGSKLWVAKLAARGCRVKHVQLPYTKETSHGKDVRDWLGEGNE